MKSPDFTITHGVFYATFDMFLGFLFCASTLGGGKFKKCCFLLEKCDFLLGRYRKVDV